MDTPAQITGPINLGNPDEFTIRELAELVIELTGSSSKLVIRRCPHDDPSQRQPDISLARAARLGAEDRAARRSHADDRLFRRAAVGNRVGEGGWFNLKRSCSAELGAPCSDRVAVARRGVGYE